MSNDKTYGDDKNCSENDLLLIIRVRGIRNVKPKIRHTLSLLKLHKPNHAVLYPKTKEIEGMLNTAKDYVAYGVVGKDIALNLILRRGEIGSKKLKDMPENGAKKIAEEYISNLMSKKNIKNIRQRILDPVFRLRPPRKGYKNIKKHYPFGALGNWGSDIINLLNRMI